MNHMDKVDQGAQPSGKIVTLPKMQEVTGRRESVRTIRNWLHEDDLVSRRPF